VEFSRGYCGAGILTTVAEASDGLRQVTAISGASFSSVSGLSCALLPESRKSKSHLPAT